MADIPDFMARRASQVHPAWALATTTVSAKRREAQKETQLQTRKWQQFIQQFKLQSKDPEIKNFDVENKTIQDVQREANAALERYEKRGATSSAPWVNVCRKAGEHASTLEVLMNLVPQDYYFSILCGGLALLLNAARRLEKIREAVMNFLSGFSESVENTSAWLKIYTNDPGLCKKAEELYVVLLEAFQSLLEWTNQSSAKHFAGALFKQNSYARQVDDIRHSITKKVRDFREDVERCLHAELKRNGETVVKVHDKVNDLHNKVDDLHDGVRDLGTEMTELTKSNNVFSARACEALCELLQGFCRDAMWQRERMERMEQIMAARATNNNFVTFQSLCYVVQPAQMPTFEITPNDLLFELGVEQIESIQSGGRLSDIQDLTQAFGFGRMLTSSRQARIATLLGDPHFQWWLTSEESAFIAVNGGETDGALETDSPLSYLIALLRWNLDNLEKTAAVIPLTFFCGHHATPGDRLEGGSGLIRSLCTQLLLAFNDNAQRLDLSFIGQTELEAIQDQDIEAYCGLFRGLLQSASAMAGHMTVFCLLDGISYFETRQRFKNLDLVISGLKSLVDDVQQSGVPLILKILATSPNQSRHAKNWLGRDAVISMPEEISDRGFIGFDESLGMV